MASTKTTHRDPYTVLGVNREAGADHIKRAYRDLAKSLHPDLNPGNAKAAEKFSAVAAAYDLLSDPKKRARFDAGEIDAAGMERPQRAYYRDFAEGSGGARYGSGQIHPEDIFSDLFSDTRRSRRRIRGADLSYRLDVPFVEAALGARKRIPLPTGKSLDVTIPAGAENGQTLRLKGQGAAGSSGGPPGDLFIEIRVEPHQHFTRRGDDILLDLPISLSEAILGATITVPTIDGKVSVKIAKGSSSGKVLRIRGKGVAGAKGRGHQLVTLQIMLPDPIDTELSETVEKWSATHPHNPRTGFET